MICFRCGDKLESLASNMCDGCSSVNSVPSEPLALELLSHREILPCGERRSMRERLEWATTGDNLERAINNCLVKFESGELSIEDFPIPAAIGHFHGKYG